MGRNVILTGFMGSGKTTVGRHVARLLNYRFVDTDQVIVERHGPIPEIFASVGEEGFREHERQVATELAEQTDLVISTGGRLMLDDENARLLGLTGRVFCLAASAEETIRRVITESEGPERPLLAGDNPEALVRSLLADRAPLYSRFEQVDTDGRSPQIIARDIIDRMHSNNPI